MHDIRSIAPLHCTTAFKSLLPPTSVRTAPSVSVKPPTFMTGDAEQQTYPR